jgi:hypothetical protein
MSKYDKGIIGIYVKPLYIFDIINNEWLKIINFAQSKKKYFLYPHLLMLSQYNNCVGTGHNPLYFLNTCKNKSLDEFIKIEKTFNL